MPSVYSSISRSLTSPAASHALYVSSGKLSAAVFGISVGEFSAEKITIKGDPTPAQNGHPPNPAHALSDYSAHSASQQKNGGKRLKQLAIKRGCLFEAGNEPLAAGTVSRDTVDKNGS